MSLLIANKRLPWKRYWVPWDGNVHSGWDGTGFITEPEGSWGRAFNPDLRHVEDVINRPFVVLSGLPGMGKTQAVRQLKKTWIQNHPTEVLLSVEGRTLDNVGAVYRMTVDSPLWQSTLASGGQIRLLVDGVDEAIMRQVDLVGALLQALENQPTERIRVILVCRAAEWSSSDNLRFATLWDSEPLGDAAPSDDRKVKKGKADLETSIVWELCHLRREDAEIAASACGINAENFLKSVGNRRIEGLAARPTTLKMLIEDFKVDPNSATTFHELYRRSIHQLCGEVNEERARYNAAYPSRERVYRSAGRLAACLLFGRKTTIAKSISTSENRSIELLLSDVEGSDVTGGNAFEIDSHLLAFTLDTPLFNFRGPNYGFEQKTYSEFLAADYVAECGVEQLRSLFCARINGRNVVSPHLAEVAARVAARNEPWCRFLCENDPEVLFRTDLSPLSNELKNLVVESYLRKVAEEDAFDHQGLDRFYASLKHPSLAEQLRPYVKGPSFNLVVRRIAIDMAGDCQLSELENDLWARARADDTCIRWIGPALKKLTGVHALTELMDVLEGKFPPATFRTLSGVAIETLVPTKLAVRDVLNYLHTSSRREAADAHHIASNYYLVKYLTKADLVPALRYLRNLDGVFDSLHSLNRFAEHIFEQALLHLEDTAISKEVTSLWVDCVDRHLPLPSGRDHYGRDEDPPRGLGLVEHQRALVAALIRDDMGTHDHPYILFEGLLSYKDSPWLLEQLDVSTLAEQMGWIKACGTFLRPEEARQDADLVSRVYEKFPGLQAVLPPKEEGYDFITSYERCFERGRKERERQTEELRRDRKPLQKRSDAIQHFLTVDDPKSRRWVPLYRWLWVSQEGDAKEDRTDHSDVTCAPGWLEVDKERQNQLVVAAREFLLENHERPLGINQSSNFSVAAYAGIRLFWPQFVSNPPLAQAIARNWPRSIFNAFRDENEDHEQLVSWCYGKRPHLGVAILLAKMKANSENGLADFALEPYRPCWDSRLANAVTRWILTWKLSVRNLFRLFHWLVLNDPNTAESLIRKAGIIGKPFSTNPHEQELVMAAWLMMPEQYWVQLKPVIEQAPSAQMRTAMLSVAYDLSHGDRPMLANLTDDQLVDLGKLVFKLFPSREDPVHPHGQVHDVRAEDNVATFRQVILNHLVSRATPGACDAIRQIAQDNASGDRIWIKWRQADAFRASSDKLVPGRSPTDISRLVLSEAAILIDSEEDLVRAVIASLQRLETRMHSRATEWRALWNEDDHKPQRARQHSSGRSPKVETAFTDVVAQWLRQDLGKAKGLVLNREVEISKDRIIDLKIDVVARGDDRQLTVPIECKRCVHSDVMTALKDQLLEQYMRPHGLRQGVYLIGWYRGAWQPKSRPVWNPASLESGQREADAWARSGSTSSAQVCAYVLDCTGEADPARFSSSTPARQRVGSWLIA